MMLVVKSTMCMLVSRASFCQDIPVSHRICAISLHTLLGVNTKHLQALVTVHGHLRVMFCICPHPLHRHNMAQTVAEVYFSKFT